MHLDFLVELSRLHAELSVRKDKEAELKRRDDEDGNQILRIREAISSAHEVRSDSQQVPLRMCEGYKTLESKLRSMKEDLNGKFEAFDASLRSFTEGLEALKKKVERIREGSEKVPSPEQASSEAGKIFEDDRGTKKHRNE